MGQDLSNALQTSLFNRIRRKGRTQRVGREGFLPRRDRNTVGLVAQGPLSGQALATTCCRVANDTSHPNQKTLRQPHW